MQCLKTTLFFSLAVHIFTGCVGDPTYCAYLQNENTSSSLSSSSSSSSSSSASQGGLKKHDDIMGDVYENNTMRCHEEQKYCFSMWYPAPENGSRTIVMQGCWNKPTETCSDTSCLAHSNYESGSHGNRNSSKFCCCRGDHCNLDIVDVEGPYQNTTASTIVKQDAHIINGPTMDQTTLSISMVSLVVVAVLVIMGYLLLRMYVFRYKYPAELPEVCEAPPLPSFELDQLKLCSLIERGRYGEVWKGLLNEHDVAVKKFNANQRRYYLNEKDIYTLPYMEHPNLCKFFGAEERIGLDGMGQYFLVITYVESGTLMSHLKNNTLTWGHLCKMAQSVTAGLAHLHTDLNLAGKVKPAIAHRDFNTRNIMVRADHTCVVCDLGFAMKIARTRFQEEGEMTSLTDVGTLRYMAPEVLDGAVNLRDCEASLKQIDVYALGLVLWEIASRCTDLYQGMTVPEYQLPFQAECGVHPSFEEMQLLVSRNKARPAFPDVWKDTNQAMRALKETIEDCWDQDAEARLTALCVEERLIEMAALWEARHKGVTPTINTVSHFGSGVGGSGTQRISSLTPHPSQTLTAEPSSMSDDHTDRNGNLQPGQSLPPDGADHTPRNVRHSHNRLSQSGGDFSISSSTTETTLTSPSEPDTVHHVNPAKANCNLNFAKTNKLLQPHQGQNPIVERNTHKHSDEELAIVGNTLVDKASISKAKTEPSVNIAPTAAGVDGGGTGNRGFSDDLYDAIADNLETSLVQNDLLNQQRHTPIPYLQNQMHDPDSAPVTSSVTVVRPKQPNIPGNGTSHSNINRANKSAKAAKAKKTKDKYNVFQNLFNWSPLSKSHQSIDNGESTGMAGSETHPMAAVLTPLLQSGQQSSQSQSALEAAKSNLGPHDEGTMNTEVRLVNGSPIVRPTTLLVRRPGSESPQQTHTGAVNAQPSRENRLSIAEVGVAKLQAPCNARPAIVKMCQKSQSSGDLSPKGVQNGSDSSVNELLVGRRPLSGSQEISRRHGGNRSSYTRSDSNQNTVVSGGHSNSNPDDLSMSQQRMQNTNDNQDTHSPLIVPSTKARPRGKMQELLSSATYDDHIRTRSCEDVSAHRAAGCNCNRQKLAKSDISIEQFGIVDGSVELRRGSEFHC